MSRAITFIFAAAVFVADQSTKLLVRARVDEFDTVALIPGCLNIIRSTNRGIAFGILSDSSSPWTVALLIAVGFAVMLVIGWLLWHSADATGQARQARQLCQWRMPLALALILGGAGGNLLDRLLHGEVTDFIDLYIGRFHWYTFNVADAAITVAAILLLLDILFAKTVASESQP